MNLQKTTLFSLLITVFMFLTSCAIEEKKRGVASKDELYVYLDSLEKCYESACGNLALASWNYSTSEKPSDIYAARTKLAEIFQDTGARNIITEWRNRSGSLADKQLTRRLELWHRIFIGAEFENDGKISAVQNNLWKKFSGGKFVFDNKMVLFTEVTAKLKEEKNGLKRKKLSRLYLDESAGLRAGLVDLAMLRNNKALAHGFPNYYSLVLHLQAIDENWLIKMLNSLEDLTRAEYEKQLAAAKKRYRIKEPGPWDIEFIRKEADAIPAKYFPADSILKTIHRFADSIGFVPDSLHYKEIINPNSSSSLSSCINIPNDTRVLIKPETGIYPYSVSFSEFGNTLHGRFTNVEYPVLKGYNWIQGNYSPAYESGMAQLFGEFVSDTLWLKIYTKAKEKEIRQHIQKREASDLFRLRILLKDFFTEYEIYKNPGIDVDSLDRAMSKKYLLIPIDSENGNSFSLPQSYITRPLSYHVLIIRDMISAQMHEALSSKFGNRMYLNRMVARWMIDHLYSSGETLEWNERIRNATGKSVEPGALLRKIGIEQSNLITKEDN